MLLTELQNNLQAPAAPAAVRAGPLPSIVQTTARSLTQTQAEIRWKTTDTVEAMINFRFYVERSESSEGPWIQISQALTDTFLFIDVRPLKRSKLRSLYYRIKVERASDTTQFIYGAAAKQEAPPDNILLEIQRHYTKILLPRLIGVWTSIFIERTFGTLCGCKDSKTRRNHDVQCTTCYLTGFVGGYMNQINTFVHFDPEPEGSQVTELGEVHQTDTSCWMGNSPRLKPRDVLIEPSGKRWRVVSKRTTQLRRHDSRQIINLAHIDTSDVEYKIPVTEVNIPADPFVGFYPANTPGLWSSNPDKPVSHLAP